MGSGVQGINRVSVTSAVMRARTEIVSVRDSDVIPIRAQIARATSVKDKVTSIAGFMVVSGQ